MTDLQDDADASSRSTARWIARVLGALLLGMALFGIWNRRNIGNIARNWDDLSEGSAIARELHNPLDMLEYITNHPDQVSLAAYELGDEAHGIFLNADRPRVMASATQLLLLCDYYAAVESGALRPDEPVKIADWEHYELPRTDGGAHASTLTQLRAGKYVTGDTVQLQDLVYGMVRFSDNAAADYVMERLGHARVAQIPTQLGLPELQAPLPFSGIYLSWENSRDHTPTAARLTRYQTAGAEAYADLVWKLADGLRHDPQLRAAERARLEHEGGLLLTLHEQGEFSRALSPHGTARGYAQLVARIQRAELPGSAALQTELRWPMEQPDVRAKFDEYASKGGAVPGIVTAATYAIPKGTKAVRVSALFFEKMPMAVWLELMHNFEHQRFEQLLLSDPAFFEHVRGRLAEPKRSPSPAL